MYPGQLQPPQAQVTPPVSIITNEQVRFCFSVARVCGVGQKGNHAGSGWSSSDFGVSRMYVQRWNDFVG